MLATVLIALLLTAGCSNEGKNPTGTGSTDFPARTLAATPETTAATSVVPPVGATTNIPRVTLRLEGDTGTSFSGICTIGTEDSVLVGQVPKTYNFDLRGQTLSCQIRKQGPGTGSLRTVLLAGDNTRSIQQTRSESSTINISYSGG